MQFGTLYNHHLHPGLTTEVLNTLKIFTWEIKPLNIFCTILRYETKFKTISFFNRIVVLRSI